MSEQSNVDRGLDQIVRIVKIQAMVRRYLGTFNHDSCGVEVSHQQGPDIADW